MLIFIYDAQAQFNWGHNYFEAGLGGGIMNYSGELTNTIFDYKHLHPAGAVFVRYNLGQYLSFRGNSLWVQFLEMIKILLMNATE